MLTNQVPKRIQLSRRRGWQMPAGAVKCDRSTVWGNPYQVGGYYPSTGRIRDANHAVDAFRISILANREWQKHVQEELRGKDLACWCPPGSPCHVDVLIEVANRPTHDDLKRISAAFRRNAKQNPTARRSEQ